MDRVWHQTIGQAWNMTAFEKVFGNYIRSSIVTVDLSHAVFVTLEPLLVTSQCQHADPGAP